MKQRQDSVVQIEGNYSVLAPAVVTSTIKTLENTPLEESRTVSRDSDSVVDVQDQGVVFENFIKNLSEDERKELDDDPEFQECFDDVFYSEYGLMLKNALFEIFIEINELCKNNTSEVIGKVFSSYNKNDQKKEYKFKFNAPSELEACLYELHEIFNVNKDILRQKCVLTNDKEKKFKNITELALSKVPCYVVKYTKEYFNKEKYKNDLERELKAFNDKKCLYS